MHIRAFPSSGSSRVCGIFYHSVKFLRVLRAEIAQNAGGDAEQSAHADLQRRMPHELLELFLIGERLLELREQVDKFIQQLRLLAGLEPDAHGVVHDDDRHDHADGERERAQPVQDPR